MFLFVNSKEFINAAPEIVAVPCWSEWMIGISISFFSFSSILKASGALISSRFITPKVGDIAFITCTNFSVSLSLIYISKTSIPAKILNNKPFPYITGLGLIQLLRYKLQRLL